jgi:hypothetical protein
MGVNVSGEFLGVDEMFHCSRASLPFIYLDISKGANAEICCLLDNLLLTQF